MLSVGLVRKRECFAFLVILLWRHHPDNGPKLWLKSLVVFSAGIRIFRALDGLPSVSRAKVMARKPQIIQDMPEWFQGISLINILLILHIFVSCTRLRILLNTICRKPGFNSLRTPLNHAAEQASNETLKETQQRNWSNASQGGQTALKEHFAVFNYETASTTQQPRGEHRGTIKDYKIAGATTWQGQGNHTFTTLLNQKC